MHIVIEIPEDYYKAIKEIPVEQSTADMLIIRYGKPLPKGHGRLKDIDWIGDNSDIYYSDEDGSCCYAWEDIDNAPTIIEADEAESEGDKKW